MDKLEMKTPNLADKNFAALAKLFPNVVTETIDANGVIVRAIDKDVLMQEINAHVVEGKEERYQFTWPDKKKSVLLANAPIAAALRPCREESVDFDTTENLYIEGDNLDVLKLLRETYLNRVKMIYIDPPYNTGHDFVYEDDFAEDTSSFLRRDGQYDEQGNRLSTNLDSNGRFHTDWLNEYDAATLTVASRRIDRCDAMI
jgi:adenine-specific DNA-methyltransferase